MSQLDPVLMHLRRERGRIEAQALGEVTDASPVGLYATLLGPQQAAQASYVVRLRTVPRREKLAALRHDIAWDGKACAVSLHRATLEPRADRARFDSGS